MKKILKTVLLTTILMSGIQAYSAGTCPTIQQVHAQEKKFQDQAFRNASRKNIPDDVSVKLLYEQEKYHANMYYGCLNYLKTTSNPDCTRLSTFATGFNLLPKDKQDLERERVAEISEKLKDKCPVEIKLVNVMINN